MMYNQGFVVTVKRSDGQILRESNGRVYLPLDSNYSLLLKNTHNRRAVAKISIDGTDVLGGKEIVIDANSTTTLERFCIDGDLTKGRKFLFVRATDSRVQDPTSHENGNIVVTFTLEKVKPVSYAAHYLRREIPQWSFRASNSGDVDSLSTNNYCAFADVEMERGSSAPSSMRSKGLCRGITPQSMVKGATVEGDVSSQIFHEIADLDLEETSTVVRIQLIPSVDSVTVSQSRHIYCTNCGKKMGINDNFCAKCGKAQALKR